MRGLGMFPGSFGPGHATMAARLVGWYPRDLASNKVAGIANNGPMRSVGKQSPYVIGFCYTSERTCLLYVRENLQEMNMTTSTRTIEVAGISKRPLASWMNEFVSKAATVPGIPAGGMLA